MFRKVAALKGSLELKEEGDAGLVKAVFSTLDVVDLDDDVTLPGAFGSQTVRIAAWGHDWHALVVGRGQITEQNVGGKGVGVLDGRFNLKTSAGRDHFETIKDQAELQEWSYGFDVEKASFGERDGRAVRFLERLKVHEVSPVMLGAAGPGRTGTLEAKGYDFSQHHEIAVASLADVKAFVERAASLAGARVKEGRVLSTANVTRLKGMLDTIRTIADDLDGLVNSAAPQDDAKSLESLLLDFERAKMQIAQIH